MDRKAEIIAPDYGEHNRRIDEAIRRLDTSGTYKDLSTVIVIAALDPIPPKVVSAWMNLMNPPNQKVYRLFVMGMEIGEAYSQAFQNIIDHPELTKYKYILTLEVDNIPPPDGLLKLLSRMEAHPEYDCIGGLYWTKGPEGVPQIWGDPHGELNFRPMAPKQGELVECCGTGMGFNLWRTEMFKDPSLRKPWFKTLANETGVMTQDLYFAQDARAHGHRFAVDCDVMVGHYDYAGAFGVPDFTW